MLKFSFAVPQVPGNDPIPKKRPYLELNVQLTSLCSARQVCDYCQYHTRRLNSQSPEFQVFFK